MEKQSNLVEIVTTVKSAVTTVFTWLKLVTLGFVAWLMLLASLDAFGYVDLQIEAPYIIELLQSVPKLLSIVEDAHASSDDMVSSSVPAELPLMKIKIVVLPDLT
ncbi:hypothetical protein [Escherichia coli]|uniref:hypothetical protein n=1 Tax=Escherichia coli TaxID=562 RepID=UPI000E212FE8|nr:hypothetical protein [Escherichia coli]